MIAPAARAKPDMRLLGFLALGHTMEDAALKDTPDGASPALAYHQVLLPRSAIIRVPLDQQQPVRIRVKPRRY
jgi:hypothetical protein